MYSGVQVGVYDAVLGGRVVVQTPRGETMLEVPEGAESGSLIIPVICEQYTASVPPVYHQVLLRSIMAP